MAREQLKTATVLAFERKLACSDGLIYCGRWSDRASSENWKPVNIREKQIRGTISNRLSAKESKDPTKIDAEVQKPNLQKVDIADLPFDTDTAKVSFSLRVLGNIATPSVCNSQEYQSTLAQRIDEYRSRTNYAELAGRYAQNIANARFLWRNRVGSEAIEVTVSHIKENHILKQWTFDSLRYSVRDFAKPDGALLELANVIQEGLSGNSFSFLRINAYARLGEGQEIYPSQELTLDSNSRGAKDPGRKSKVLYHVDGIAAIHSQKIGNALRTVDTWYQEAASFGPIPAEVYGSVTSRGVAYRKS